MLTVSSFEGSAKSTGLNLRSNALSCSIYFLYSLIVVAPINCYFSSCKQGFKILAASIAPSAAPAPTIV